MPLSIVVRRSLMWAVAALAACAVCVVCLIAAVDAGYGRTLVVRFVAYRLGRPVQVNGIFEPHLLSLNPRIVAEKVSIGNPPWMPAGRAAEIGRLSMVLELPRFGHPGGIARLEAQRVSLYLARDAKGRANWQLIDPARPHVHRNSAIIRSLSLPDAHVVLADARRHLQFDGEVTALDPGGPGPPQPLRLVGAGQLNGSAVSFSLIADPLTSASHSSPYHFTFTESSSGSHLVARGELPQPFDYTLADARFEAAGQDLKDLFYLTGVHLLDTGDYRLTGKFSRRGTRTDFSELAILSAQSDIRGSVSIESASGQPQFDIDLHSGVLRLADIGARAAGRTSAPKSPLLLSDAMLAPAVLRSRSARVSFSATQVEVGKVALNRVSARATVDRNVLDVSSASAEVLGGRVNARLRLDATRDIPSASADIRLKGLELEQLPRKGPGSSAVQGMMGVHIQVTGTGRSVHQVAATANGTVRIWIPQGEIRESFAELSGVDLRGLGLLLTKNQREVPIRCAFAEFTAQDGLLTARSLIADTEPVLITGDGQLHLDTESLDLELRGHPKGLRLFRLRAPISIRGTLAQPLVAIQKHHSTLVVVDPGRTQDADCPALLPTGDDPRRP